MNRVRLIMAALIVAAFAGASLCRSMGWFIHDIYWTQEWLGGDKASHAWMGAGLMLAAYLAFPATWSRRGSAVALLVVLGLLAAEESSQLLTTTREFSLVDLGMGMFGAMVSFTVGHAAVCMRKPSAGSI